LLLNSYWRPTRKERENKHKFKIGQAVVVYQTSVCYSEELLVCHFSYLHCRVTMLPVQQMANYCTSSVCQTLYSFLDNQLCVYRCLPANVHNLLAIRNRANPSGARKNAVKPGRVMYRTT